MLRAMALAIGCFLACAGCDSSPSLSRQERLDHLPRFTQDQIDQFRGNNCLKSLPAAVVAPKRFTPEQCRSGRVDFSIPEKLFGMSGLDKHQHMLIVTGPDGDRLLTSDVELAFFENPAAEQLANGLIRMPTSGVMGHDQVLKSDIVSNLFLYKPSGGICRSTNMSLEPRTFMVICWQTTPNATLIAFGPQAEAVTVLRHLQRIAPEIDPTI